MTPTQQGLGLSARIIRFRDLPSRSWRNGGGVTREIAARSDSNGELTWRVSIADVAASVDFSAFPGLDRILMLCRGTNMLVIVDGSEHLLQPWDLVRFSGDAATQATLLDGHTMDLNVMTRRGFASASVTVTRIDGIVTTATPPSATVLLVAVDGRLECRGAQTTQTQLRDFDTVHMTASTEPIDIVGAGRVARVEIQVTP